MKAWQWVEDKLRGHVSLGPVTVFGANAMHWTVQVATQRWGYVCFRLPLPCFGSWCPLYFYCSPNATPWASTYFVGRDRYERDQQRLARERLRRFGHNFDTSRLSVELGEVNA